MKKRIFALAAMLLFCMSLFGCERRREFEKIEGFSMNTPSTEAAASTEPTTPLEGRFTFANYIQMGMTIAEIQGIVGQVPEQTMVENPTRISFSVDFSGVFIQYQTTKSVVFLFEPENSTLIQMQYRGSTEWDGSPATAIALFDQIYGKQALYQGKYPNHIWQADDVYILLSEIDENQFAVTYTEKTWFETYYEKETDAYRRAQ